MWPLIKKNSILFLVYVLPIFAMVTIIWFGDLPSADNPNNLYSVFAELFWMWILTLTFVGVDEQIESKNKGYEFLKTLPVTDAEIVKAKFLLALIMVMLFVGLFQIMFSFLKAPPLMLRTIRFITLLNGIVCLLLVALWYIGVFKFGFSRMYKYSCFVTIGTAVLMLMSVRRLLPRLKAHILSIADYISQINWFVQLLVVAAAVYCYYLLMKAAIKVKIATKE